MSGLEVAVSVLALLEAAITATRRIHQAYKRKKDFPRFCERLQDRLLSIQDIVRTVNDEPVLWTPKVAIEVSKLLKRGREVQAFLGSLRKSPARLFFHELFSGTEDEQRLDEIIMDLEANKSSLIFAVQVVGVGLKEDHEHDIKFVTTASAKRIDGILRERLHVQDGLRIMRVIEDRKSDVQVTLTEEDLESLQAVMDPTGEESRTKRERIIFNNVARYQATQINASLGKDIWAEVEKIVVENNKAGPFTTQINYPMTLHAFYSGLTPLLIFWVAICFCFYHLVTRYFQRS